MEIIGQEELVKKIAFSYENKTLPNSILIVGEEGSGKHLLSNYISNLVSLPLIDITESVCYDFLSSLYVRTDSNVYLVNVNKLTNKEQNELLKFLEEPPEDSYTILISDSITSVIETVRNRCSIYSMKAYKIDALRKFLQDGEDEYVLQFCKTPGDVIKFSKSKVLEMETFVNKIFEKIGFAGYANILKICDFIDWKDDSNDLFCKDLFFKVLLSISFNNSVKNSFSNSFEVFILTDHLMKDIQIPRINEKKVFENYLFSLKRLYDTTST